MHTWQHPAQISTFPTRLTLMGIRFFAPADDAGQGGGGGGGTDGYKPPATQADLDELIRDRVARAARTEAAKYPDYEDLKQKAGKWDAQESGKQSKDGAPDDGKKGEQQSQGLSEADVQKRIETALAGRDAAHAAERAGDKLATALKGRDYDPAKLFGLDFSQFVTDGKTDETAIADWVKDNTQEREQQPEKRRRDPSQGGRDNNANAGSVQSGRDRYEAQRSRTKKSKED